jgi:hypothetical protein
VKQKSFSELLNEMSQIAQEIVFLAPEDSLPYQGSAGRKRPANRRSHSASLHTRQNQITDLMEIASDKDAERANVLCWFKQIGHHYGHHASRRRRPDADVRVFQGQT